MRHRAVKGSHLMYSCAKCSLCEGKGLKGQEGLCTWTPFTKPERESSPRAWLIEGRALKKNCTTIQRELRVALMNRFS